MCTVCAAPLNPGPLLLLFCYCIYDLPARRRDRQIYSGWTRARRILLKFLYSK